MKPHECRLSQLKGKTLQSSRLFSYLRIIISHTCKRCFNRFPIPLNMLNFGMMKPQDISSWRISFIKGVITIIPRTICRVSALKGFTFVLASLSEAYHTLAPLFIGFWLLFTCLELAEYLSGKWSLMCLPHEDYGPKGLGC